MTELISIKGLCKTYGLIKALNHADFSVQEGEIHGLFGANGAGKSTMIRIIIGITKPDSGFINVKGIDVVNDPDKVREVCTPVVEIPFLYKDMRLFDMLDFFCELNGIYGDEKEMRIKEALYLTGTGDILDKRYGLMSLGQQHRSEVARAIATSNDIMMMDEPFIGIDIDTKRNLKIYLRKWVKEKPGRAIVFTSHNLMENEGLVDKLTFIMNGKTIETGTVDHFKSAHLKPTFILTVDNIEKARSIILKSDYARYDQEDKDKIWVSVEEEENVKKLIKELALEDIGVMGVERSGSVEDVFSKMVEVAK
jgi:ABC-type multidrug transport system ATPase subunit